MNRSTPSRLSALVMAMRKRRAPSWAFGPSCARARAIRAVCNPASFMRQRLAFGGDVEQPLAPIIGALLLHHVALVDELLEHASERLLGDLENVEQLGNLHPRVAIDEMQHPVMGAAEAEFRQHLVGIADEIPIGEEQELDDLPHRLAIASGTRLRERWTVGRNRGS